MTLFEQTKTIILGFPKIMADFLNKLALDLQRFNGIDCDSKDTSIVTIWKEKDLTDQNFDMEQVDISNHPDYNIQLNAKIHNFELRLSPFGGYDLKADFHFENIEEANAFLEENCEPQLKPGLALCYQLEQKKQ